MELLLDLVQDDLDPAEVLLGLLPLRVRLPDVVVELRDPGDVVEDLPAVHVGHRDDPLDVPLLNEVVPLGADPGVGEEAVELVQGGLPVVHIEVRVVPARDARRDRDVARELHLVRLDGDRAVPVVEEEGDLAVGGALLVLPAVPDQVREALGPDRLRALGTEHEEDRVRDVRLPGAVRARHRRVPGEERDPDLPGERLEVLYLDFFQEHGITATEGVD